MILPLFSFFTSFTAPHTQLIHKWEYVVPAPRWCHSWSGCTSQNSYIFVLFFHDPFGILSGGMLACPYINECKCADCFNSHWHSSALTMIQSDQRDEGWFGRVLLFVCAKSMNKYVCVCVCSACFGITCTVIAAAARWQRIRLLQGEWTHSLQWDKKYNKNMDIVFWYLILSLPC